MADIEHRLRQELKTEAERINLAHLRPLRPPQPSGQSTAQPSGQSRARRWLAPLAAMAAVVVVIVGVALAVGWRRSPPVPVSGPSQVRSGRLPSRPAADPPAFAGALQSSTGTQQWIRLFSSLTGRTVRRVAAFGDSLTGNGMALSPDSRFVYVTLSGPGQIHIDRITVATGRRNFVADGAQPAVSPDGRYLAYATGRLFTRLAIRDLHTGVTRVVNLAALIGSGSGLLNGQVTWLGGGAQVVAMPMPFGAAAAARTPSTTAAAATRNSCGRQTTPDSLCLVLVNLDSAEPRATRVFVPGTWGQPLISGDVARSGTLLLTDSLNSRARVGVATISAAGVAVRRVAALPPDVLPEAFAPGGDRILYLRAHGRPSLWVATISGGRLSGAHLLFTDNSKFAFGAAAW
jgi:hypothetical protein